jgi:LysM domain
LPALPRLPRLLPPYRIVRARDTYAEVSARTGLSVDRLEVLNPDLDPQALSPVQRLRLWRRPPGPPQQPPGSRFWIVRPGDSFGPIAANTGISLDTLSNSSIRS